MSLKQKKATSPAEIRTWTLDLDAMASCAPWATRRRHMLGEEVEAVLDAFPTFIGVLGRPMTEDEAWVEAVEPILCQACGDFIVFDEGCRCVGCRQAVQPPEETRVGLVGRIPGLISGRPFDEALQRRLSDMIRQGRAGAELYQRSVISAGGRRYLVPRVGLWFPGQWPHSDPPVMVWPEYFEVLNIPPDHVYFAGPYYRLCLFAAWREQSAQQVMHNRVVPRLLIDLMVADLVALGVLDEALESLECSLYELYNKIGRPGEVEDFKALYDGLVRRRR